MIADTTFLTHWIAGFCRYYREPIMSLDDAFDRVPRLRRLPY